MGFFLKKLLKKNIENDSVNKNNEDKHYRWLIKWRGMFFWLHFEVFQEFFLKPDEVFMVQTLSVAFTAIPQMATGQNYKQG